MISYHSLEDGKSDRIMAVDCHPDMSESVVTFATVGGGGGEGEIRIWAIDRRRQRQDDEKSASHPPPTYCAELRKGHEGSVNCVRWSPDGCRVASAGDRGTVCAWGGRPSASWWRQLDDEQQKPSCVHLPHADDVYDVAWSPCGDYLLTGAIDHSSSLWHVATKRRVRTINDHSHYVQGVAFDPRGECFATQGSDKTVRVYPLPDDDWKRSKKPLVGKILKFWPNEEIPSVADNATPREDEQQQNRYPVFASELQFTGFFRRLTFATDGEALLVPAALAKPEDNGNNGTRSSGAVAYARGKLADGPCAYFPAGEGSTSVAKACPVLFNKGSRSIFALALSDAVVAYDLSSTQPLVVVKGMHRAPLTDIAWARDGSLLVVASGDGYLSFLHFDEADLGTPDAPPPLKVIKTPGPTPPSSPRPNLSSTPVSSSGKRQQLPLSPVAPVNVLVARKKPKANTTTTTQAAGAAALAPLSSEEGVAQSPASAKKNEPIDLTLSDGEDQPATSPRPTKHRRITPTLVSLP